MDAYDAAETLPSHATGSGMLAVVEGELSNSRSSASVGDSYEDEDSCSGASYSTDEPDGLVECIDALGEADAQGGGGGTSCTTTMVGSTVDGFSTSKFPRGSGRSSPMSPASQNGADGALPSLSTTMSRRSAQLALPEPARSIPRSSLDVVDRKQHQRRLLESRLREPLMEAFHLDHAAAATRYPAHVDRGKLLYQLDVSRGFALNALTAMPRRSTRLVRSLPPTVQHRHNRVAIVHRALDGALSASVEYPHRHRLPAVDLVEMGYSSTPPPPARGRVDEARTASPVGWRLASPAKPLAHGGGHPPASTGTANTEAVAASPASFPHRLRRSITEGGTSDEPLPPPSGGAIEPSLMHHHHHHHHHHRGSSPSRGDAAVPSASVRDMFPHLVAKHLVPPELSLSSVVYPNGSQCTPPPHLRRDQRDFRLLEHAEEMEELLLQQATNRPSLDDAKQPMPTSSESSSPRSRAPAVGGAGAVLDADATPVPRGIDDRQWGCALRDPHAEAAARLRSRMESQDIPSNTPKNFGALDYLIEASTVGEDVAAVSQLEASTVAESGSAADLVAATSMAVSGSAAVFRRRRSTLHIPPPMPIDVRDDVLLTLAIGVNGVTEGASLPYTHAEANAQWFDAVMQHIGASTVLMRGYEATHDGVREAIGRLVGRARQASQKGKRVKMVVYVSGKARIAGRSGDVLFAPHDAVPLLSDAMDAFVPVSVNLHELASRDVDLGVRREDSGIPRSADDVRWSYPVVLYDVIVDRCKKDDAAFVPPATPAAKVDFWRGTYYGGILALQHDGGTLSASCSARHHGLIVYYTCKAAEGKLSGYSQHIGSISQITQYIAAKLRNRVVPTMELRCAPLPGDFAPRTAEEIVHPQKTLYATQAAKRQAKRLRDKTPCRWTLTCEVTLEYRYNPTMFVTVLSKRIKELLNAKHRGKGSSSGHRSNAPPLMLWMGSRRMEHRFYMPIGMDEQATNTSTDVFRFELMSAITRSGIAENGGGTGQYYVEASLESIENCRFDFIKSAHCMLLHSQGVAHNRWTHNPFVGAWMSGAGGETMGGIRSHSDADLDFIYVLSECAVKAQGVEILSFLDDKHSTELITIHGSSSVNDLRRILKFVRFGLLDIAHCMNCHVLKCEVTSLGEDDEAEAAAVVLVQKVVRRYLTARVMKSRLAAAMTYYRTLHQEWVDALDAFTEDLFRWYIDFKEEAFVAVEAAQQRGRHALHEAAAAAYDDAYEQMAVDWVLLEEECRYKMVMEELVASWALRRLGAALPMYVDAAMRTRHCSEVEHAVRGETLQRHKHVGDEFYARHLIRTQHATEWAEVLAAAMPKRLGKRVKRPKARYDLPLDQLLRH